MARITGHIGAYPFDSTSRHTTQQLPLGTRAFDGLGNEYVYVKAAEALDALEAVTFGLSTLGWDNIVNTTNVDEVIVGVAHADFAQDEYGFILHKGVGTVLATDNVTAGAPLFAGANDGLLTEIVAGTAGSPADAVINRTKEPSRVVCLVTSASASTTGCTAYFG